MRQAACSLVRAIGSVEGFVGLRRPLQMTSRTVDFEVFRPVLGRSPAYRDSAKDDRLPYDPGAISIVLFLMTESP